MEESEEDRDGRKGKITVSSPNVLAAILDEDLEFDKNGLQTVDNHEPNSTSAEELGNSLELSLSDSLESTELQNTGEFSGVGEDIVVDSKNGHENESSEFITTADQLESFPKSSTPVQNFDTASKTQRAHKPPRPQPIVERNRENLGKRGPRRGYAQVHAIKYKTKLDKETKRTRNQDREVYENRRDSTMENVTENMQENQDSLESSRSNNDPGMVSHLDYDKHNFQTSNFSTAGHNDDRIEPESSSLGNSYLDNSVNTSQYHGTFIPGDLNPNVSSNFNSVNPTYTQQLPYAYNPPSYGARGYSSAVGNLRQSHVAIEEVSPQLHNHKLSTQSAPPDMYGNRRTLFTNPGRFPEDESYFSLAGPYADYVSPTERNKIPESSLNRKFSSEPYLAQSSSPLLQKITNSGRNSKGFGSYSSLRQPFDYKPYTLKDYRSFTGAGSRLEHWAGGLGPNVDTDDFKGKMKKVSKQREYASMLRSQHAFMRNKQQRKEGPRPPAKPPQLKEAEVKRQTALNYAKNVPKPKQMASRRLDNKDSTGSGHVERREQGKDITMLELLKRRHEKEKNDVDVIRKDLASKIRL